jgi:hypothetical protein
VTHQEGGGEKTGEEKGGKEGDRERRGGAGDGAKTCTVATSILAEDSFGISQMKLRVPSSFHRGMSCHVEMTFPFSCMNSRKSVLDRAPCPIPQHIVSVNGMKRTTMEAQITYCNDGASPQVYMHMDTLHSDRFS